MDITKHAEKVAKIRERRTRRPAAGLQTEASEKGGDFKQSEAVAQPAKKYNPQEYDIEIRMHEKYIEKTTLGSHGHAAQTRALAADNSYFSDEEENTQSLWGGPVHYKDAFYGTFNRVQNGMTDTFMTRRRTQRGSSLKKTGMTTMK